MTVAKYGQPDFTEQDSATYKGNIDAGFSVLHQVAGMFAPHESSPAAMTITIDAGALFPSGSIVSQNAQTSGTITAPSVHPRIDRAVIDMLTGALSIIPGSENSSPSPPAITAGKLPVAQIALVVGQTSILNANITDERIPAGAATASALIFGQCRLTLSSGNLKLSPYGGNQITIAGVNYSIPAAGITLAPTSLTPSTLYYIYAYNNSGTLTLEASVTGHSPDTTAGNIGVEIKTGDASRTLVGMAYCVTGPAWASSATQQLVVSYFNRKMLVGSNNYTSDRPTTSSTYAEPSTEIRIQFLTWADDAVFGSIAAAPYSNSASYGVTTALGIDGLTPQDGFEASIQTDAQYLPVPVGISGYMLLAEGFHYATLLACVSHGSGITSTYTAATALAGPYSKTELMIGIRG